MNLIQIQEHLKDLPTQAIMGYANGQNPEVPPYMALSELNRRKSMEQRAAQQPTQSVKDKLESQVSQAPQGPQGIAQLPQAMPPQGPEQGLPQGLPQMPQGVPGMADVGLAGLPVSDDMFNYAPGGIVAFANEENDQVVPEENMDGGGDSNEGEKEAMAGVRSIAKPAFPVLSMEDAAKEIMRKRIAGETDIPEVISPADARAAAIKQNPKLAPILNSLPGEAIEGLIKNLATRNQASQDKFKENEGRLGLAGLSNALIAAGEATRGHKGLALGEALGGFGKSYGRYTEESVKRDEAQQALQRQYEIETAKLQSDVQSLQRAYANNDVNAIAQYSKDVADRKAKIEAIQGTAASNGLDIGIKEQNLAATIAHQKAQNAMSQAQLEESRRHHKGQEQEWANAKANRAEQLQIMKDSRPTAESREIDRINQTIGQRVRSLEARQKDIEFGSDEWNKIQDVIDDTFEQAYRAHKIEPPPRIPRPKIDEPEKKPGFFSGLFGSSPAPKAVSFDQLPK